jgi:hypothetical protein
VSNPKEFDRTLLCCWRDPRVWAKNKRARMRWSTKQYRYNSVALFLLYNSPSPKKIKEMYIEECYMDDDGGERSQLSTHTEIDQIYYISQQDFPLFLSLLYEDELIGNQNSIETHTAQHLYI